MHRAHLYRVYRDLRLSPGQRTFRSVPSSNAQAAGRNTSRLPTYGEAVNSNRPPAYSEHDPLQSNLPAYTEDHNEHEWLESTTHL